MKMMSTSAYQSERERRYPFLVIFDLILHWSLCAAIYGCALVLFWVIMVNTAPHRIVDFLLKIKG